MKTNRMGNDICKYQTKETIVLIFISYSMFEVDVKIRKIIRVKEGHYKMIKKKISSLRKLNKHVHT